MKHRESGWDVLTYLHEYGKPGVCSVLRLSPLAMPGASPLPTSEQHQALPPQGALEHNQVSQMSLLKPFTTSRPEGQPHPCTIMSPALTLTSAPASAHGPATQLSRTLGSKPAEHIPESAQVTLSFRHQPEMPSAGLPWLPNPRQPPAIHP